MGSPVIEEHSERHGGTDKGPAGYREELGLGLNWRPSSAVEVAAFDLKGSVEVRLMEKEGPAFQTEAAA